MDRITYAKSLINQGIDKEEFISLMEQYDIDPNSVETEEVVEEEELVVDEPGKLIDVAESSAAAASENANAEKTELNSESSSSESVTAFNPSNLNTNIDGGPEGGPEDVLGGPGEMDDYGNKFWSQLNPGQKIILNTDEKAHVGANAVYTDADKQKYGFHTSKKRKFLQPGKKVDEVKFTKTQFIGDGPDDFNEHVLNTMLSDYLPRGKNSKNTDYFDREVGSFEGEDGEDLLVVGVLTTDKREEYKGDKLRQKVIDLPGESENEYGLVAQQSKLFHKIPIMTKRKYYDEWLNDKDYGKDAGVDLQTYLYEYKDNNGDFVEDSYIYSSEGTFLEDVPNQVNFASNAEVEMQRNNNANVFETDPNKRVIKGDEGEFLISNDAEDMEKRLTLLKELEITSESTAPGLIDANPYDDDYMVENIQASLDNIDKKLNENIAGVEGAELSADQIKELNIERENLVNDQKKYISARTAATMNFLAWQRSRTAITSNIAWDVAKEGTGAGLFSLVKYKKGEFFVQPKIAGGYGGFE